MYYSNYKATRGCQGALAREAERFRSDRYVRLTVVVSPVSRKDRQKCSRGIIKSSLSISSFDSFQQYINLVQWRGWRFTSSTQCGVLSYKAILKGSAKSSSFPQLPGLNRLFVRWKVLTTCFSESVLGVKYGVHSLSLTLILSLAHSHRNKEILFYPRSYSQTHCLHKI